MRSFRKRIVVLFVVGFSAVLLSAQNSSDAIRPKGNSPYSRFGLGDPVGQYYAHAAGMGGLSAAFQDPYYLNTQNPAALPFLQATAFEVGVFGRFAGLQDNNGRSDQIWSGNLNYLSLGFPLINPIRRALDKNNSPWHFGMSIALQPYHTVAYDIRAAVPQDNELNLVTTNFKGSGGNYRLQWGNGVRYKNLSAGVSLGYLFGKSSNSRRVDFDSIQPAYSTQLLDEISVKGFVWNAGVQYVHEFGKKDRNQAFTQRLTIGFYGNSATDFRTNSSRLYTRNSGFSNPDTLIYQIGASGEGTLPAQWAAGIVYERVNKFRIGAEYSRARWSQYRNEAKPEVLANTQRIAAGVEYIPEFNSYDNYFRRVRYRAGAVYAQDARVINGNQLQEVSLSTGIGLPLIMPRQQISFVNLSVEAGQFGLQNALKENFVRITLGLTLNDNTWFFKRKFN